jgi:ribonuclease HI
MPHYSNWTCILDSNHSPANYSDKHRICFFLDKSFASEEIHLIKDGNRILSAIDLIIDNDNIRKLRLINLYNPPRTFEGIKILSDWLDQHNDRRIPSFIFMDSNLHHRSWNPPLYNHTHQQSKDLVRSCGRHGFKIVSEKGTPTFMNRRTSSTVIDLTWGNFSAFKFIESCCTSSVNFGSDHQSIVLNLNFNPHSVPVTRLSVDLKNVNSEKFCFDLSQCLEKLNDVSLDCSDDIDSFVDELTISFQNSIDRQKKTVNSNTSKFKAWWDKDILSPIIQKRNQARKWMLIAHSVQASDCYQFWQKKFKDKVFELKRNHWRKFLAESKDHQIFQAYKFTKSISNGNIAPLLNENNDLTSDKEEQARLLFKGTSEVPINCTLDDIVPPSFSNPFPFPDISFHEIDIIMSHLPKKKASGHDEIANEVLIWSKNIVIPYLIKLFSACLRLGYFSSRWRHAITVIIRKADKDSYANPGSYRPIALLSCLGKIFESLLTKRITYWAENNNVIAHGHFGGRANRCTDDANLFLSSWIRQKWRERKIVSALFLDVKSAYPSVIKDRLIDTLINKNIPSYLGAIVQSILSNRSTSLRMDGYLSPSFDLKCGLPQGSPLSPILYIIYNSNLLISNPLGLLQDKISLGFIDDVTHFVADKHLERAISSLESEGDRSLEWGKRNNAIFDKKKANFMIFTHKKVDVRPFRLGDVRMPKSDSVKYLGIILDPQLSFKLHLDKVKKCGISSIGQLNRISRCSFGLGLQQSKNLIISVLRSRILYGSCIWASKRNESAVKNVISKINNQANRIILGVFRTTPCNFLNRDSPLIPFFDVLKKKNHLYVSKKLTATNDHPIKQLINHEINNLPRSHLSSIHNLLDNHLLPEYDLQSLEIIKFHVVPPWSNFSLDVNNLNIKKEKAKEIVTNQISDKKVKKEILLFSDGSNIPDKGTASAALLNNSISFACRINDAEKASAYEAEVQAINIGLDIISNEAEKNNLPPFNNVNIFSDNQATLQVIANPPLSKSNQSTFIQIFDKLNILITDFHFSISLLWCPAHVGIPENEKVDQLAKEATEGNTLFDLEQQSRTLSNIQQIINSKFSFVKKKDPIIRNHISLSNIPIKIFNSLNRLERGLSSTIYQLRSGHSPLNDFLFHIDKIDSPDCSHCRSPETVKHFLIECRRFNQQRKNFRSRLISNKIKINPNSLKDLLDNPSVFDLLSKFILDTKRFKSIKIYTEEV